ncbi:hypothetical protein F4821DRAFT_112085 [Hypoxylon rubiginosum]|uniref:Uncharacterized protein n=1 Tax=Hypoxylon rubiginosum TaxID=110542 RepID=A0ACC0DJY4_9PEZI|nr:hypothetical protein F4821DRAFT_112085 [Hypoxylon rubiginosum]
MSENLRVKLAKSKVEQPSEQHSPWPPGIWNAALEAYRSGWRPAEPRFPVVISENGPLNSPEKLQKLADLPSVPEVSKTRVAEFMAVYDEDEVQNAEEVQIADVTWRQLLLLEERVEQDEKILVWFPDSRTNKLITRNTCVVKSIKEEFLNMDATQEGKEHRKVEDSVTDKKVSSP